MAKLLNHIQCTDTKTDPKRNTISTKKKRLRKKRKTFWRIFTAMPRKMGPSTVTTNTTNNNNIILSIFLSHARVTIRSQAKHGTTTTIDCCMTKKHNCLTREDILRHRQTCCCLFFRIVYAALQLIFVYFLKIGQLRTLLVYFHYFQTFYRRI